MSFDPNTSFCGECQDYPQYDTTPGGGGSTRRCVMVNASDLTGWMNYFTFTNVIDPYTQNAIVWKIRQKPFEREWRSSYPIDPFGPGVATYDFALLEIDYESTGMAYYVGQGVVREECKPRIEQEPIGIARSGFAASDSLVWSSDDANGQDGLYYGEHPHFESGGKEIIFTFPFAPTNSEPFQEGTINSDDVTGFVSLMTFPSGTLKYMGMALETSFMIPGIAGPGVRRYRKSFLFHYRNPANADGSTVDWNTHWRARDQMWLEMNDAFGNPYEQYPSSDYSGYNWWL